MDMFMEVPRAWPRLCFPLDSFLRPQLWLSGCVRTPDEV